MRQPSVWITWASATALTCISSVAFATSPASHSKHYKVGKNTTPTCVEQPIQSPVLEKADAQDSILPNYYSIALYKPTYFLPYYYTGSPYNAVYKNYTPNDESINHGEVKYQISLKVPVWKDMFNHPSSLMFGYTQLSYWQLYNKKSFFRETNYEPELFLANKINYRLSENWYVNFLNLGLVHQSNGEGNGMQRGWNRLYLEAIASNQNWMISLQPWYVLSTNKNNDNITNYLGYGRVLVAYKYYRQVFAVQAHSLIENGGHRATGEFTWSFPLVPYLKGYVQFFTGYGQSLIEYNHRTNSGSIGLALNDWV